MPSAERRLRTAMSQQIGTHRLTNNEIERRIATQWLVYATGLPRIRRRCLRCTSATYYADGTFRVNANGKLLDVWILARCVGCGKTVNLTVLERVHVRAVDPSTLTRFHDNDIELAAKYVIAAVHGQKNIPGWVNEYALEPGGAVRTQATVKNFVAQYQA